MVQVVSRVKLPDGREVLGWWAHSVGDGDDDFAEFMLNESSHCMDNDVDKIAWDWPGVPEYLAELKMAGFCSCGVVTSRVVKPATSTVTLDNPEDAVRFEVGRLSPVPPEILGFDPAEIGAGGPGGTVTVVSVDQEAGHVTVSVEPPDKKR